MIAKDNQLSKSSQRFQTIVARVRPHRVAVLIDANDTDWQRSCLRIIEYLSQVWGGAHSLIIPTNGDTIDNCFWELLSSFDPDIICRYQKTGYDLFMAGDPDYMAHVERQIAQAIQEGVSPESAERIREDLNKSPLEGALTVPEVLKTQLLKCRRCGTVQQYVQASWNHPDEPSWFYKLDEIVFHMITHDGHVDILTLDKLRRDSKRDFQFAPELQIRLKDSNDWEMEIDICAISAGQLQIGEAKSNDSLKSNKKIPAIVAQRYRTLAEEMNASGVVFATYAEAWDISSLTAMNTEFAKNPYLHLTRFGNQNLTRVAP